MAAYREEKGHSLLDPADYGYSVIDIETTGLQPSKSEIIEIAAINVGEDGEIEDTFHSLIKPKKAISKRITSINGITNEMVADAPSIEEVLPKFIAFIGDNTVIGHNVNFDVNFIYDASENILGEPFTNDCIDTLRWSRKVLPDLEEHSLSALIEHYGITNDQEHRALSDCKATKELYEMLLDDMDSQDIDLHSAAESSSMSMTINVADILKKMAEKGELPLPKNEEQAPSVTDDETVPTIANKPVQRPAYNYETKPLTTSESKIIEFLKPLRNIPAWGYLIIVTIIAFVLPFLFGK